MYSSSDAWFLTSLIFSEGWSSLKQVIKTGDLINHAILTKDEINNALSVFVDSGYVEINDRKQMRATGMALKLRNISFYFAGLFRKTDIILERLNREKEKRSAHKTEYFTISEIEHAYREYIEDMHKSKPIS